MLKLDNNLLEELGLGSLPEAQKRQMLQHIYDTLELRVGTQLANQMTDKQLEEFEKFIDSGGDANQAQALQWLETNLPNYKDVVQQTFDALKAEVKGMAPQLLASAAQQPQEAQIVSSQPVAPTQPQPAQYPPVQQAPYAPPQPAVTPQQVMPSQQAPVMDQPWQQPLQTQQPATGYVPQAPYPSQPATVPVQQAAVQPQQPVPSVPDPLQQTQQQSFVQPQGVPTPPPAAPWQPAPSVQPWQPGPPTQQPPQATA